MGRSFLLAALLCLACEVRAHDTKSFLPFAGLEELAPRRIHDFCGGEGVIAEDGRRLRLCQHSFKRTLEDGGDVELGWRMHADPDSILSLDVEAQHGAGVVSCAPGALELDMPRGRAERLAPGHLVIASRFVHGCRHLGQEHLYGRVREVRRGGSGSKGGSSRLRLATEELPSFAHAVPSLAFHFSYMPAEARDHVKHPEMRTDFGSNREFLQSKRRLMATPFQLIDKLNDMAKKEGVEEDDGGFQQGSRTASSVHNRHSILNFAPKQLSNFGWNWNFLTNTTESPNFDVEIPGAEGVIKVRHPYVKVHAGIYLNFSSEFSLITKAPKVRWTAGIHGHGYFQARVLANLNTTASAKVNPFSTFKLPLLESMRAPQWFEKIDLAVGSMPVSVEPGFQFDARMYHSGTFHGAMAVGGRTHGVFSPSLSYDSQKGFDVNMQATLLDSDVWPPLWMIFTKRFELGVMFMPTILMRGDFAGLKKSTLAIDMQQFLNLTVTRGPEPPPQQLGGEQKTLTIYPLRVMGLDANGGQRQYKVRIDTNGQTLETSSQMNWGQVAFHDHVSQFDAGKVSEAAAAAQTIVVTVIEIDERSPALAAKTLGWGEVRCTSFEHGECRPSPTLVRIRSGGADVAAVELAVLWDDAPELWLGSHVHGMVVSFPEVVLRGDVLASSSTPDDNSSDVDDSPPLTLHLTHGGITYVAPLVQEAGGAVLPTFRGGSAVDLGTGFLRSWLPCAPESGARCEPSRLEIYRGGAQVAASVIPELDWTSPAPKSGLFLAGSGRKDHNSMHAPALLPLQAPGNGSDSPAVVKMRVDALSPLSSSLFLKPGAGSKVSLGGSQSFAWTLADVDREARYSFELSVLRRTRSASNGSVVDGSQPRVQGHALVPVPGASYAATLECAPQPMGGLPAEEVPCSFEQALPFEGGSYEAGDVAAVLLRWTRGGRRHQLLSPAFEIAATASEAPPAHTRRLWSQAAWNERVQQHESCRESDLRFRLGAGMLVRGRADHLGLPRGFPVLGDLGSQPELNTGFHKIAAIKPGTDARDLLPDALCKDGLCEGALPGCREASFEKRHYPFLRFAFNRRFYYSDKTKGKFHGAVKEALAYAFSILPEVLDVAIREFNESQSAAVHEETSTTTEPPRTLSTTVSATAKQGRAVPSLPVRLPSLPAAGASNSTTHAPYFTRWWQHVERRLGEPAGAAGAEADGERSDGMPERHHVTVRFAQGVPFTVDRPLVEMMLRHGYFMEVEDDAAHRLGPLRISSFSVEGEGGAAPARGDPGVAASSPASPSPTGARALARLPCILGLLSAASAALLLTGIRWRTRGTPIYAVQGQMEAGLVE